MTIALSGARFPIDNAWGQAAAGPVTLGAVGAVSFVWSQFAVSPIVNVGPLLIDSLNRVVIAGT